MLRIPRSFLFVSMLTLLLAQPFSVLACGMSMISYGGSWTYGNDSAEQSFIHYESGEEKLLISRTFDNGAHGTVWVIPVPSKPDSVAVDVLPGIPTFSGYDVVRYAHQNLSDIRDVLFITQVYPIIPMIVFKQMVSTTNITQGVQTQGLRGTLGGMTQGVTVYQHLEKEGMVAEVLSAEHSDDLYKYLQSKGLHAEKDSIAILQEYIGKDFAFVASWVDPAVRGEPSTKGLLMTFPTGRMFYPLKPESGTPGDGLPETITVIGHVTPDLYPNIADATEVNYFYSPYSVNEPDFFSSDDGFAFTKIVINVKPSNLTQDLYISPDAPLRILHAQAINLYGVVYSLLLLILLSLASAYFAAWAVSLSAQNRSHILRVGLFNCLTLVGVVLAALSLISEKRVRFVVIFSLTFIILVWFSWWLLDTSLGM